MSRGFQILLCLTFTALFCAQTPAQEAATNQLNSGHSSSAVASLPRQSPITFFRKLLAMTPAERNQSLTNRSAASRARILAKVKEYKAMPRDERELRLRATNLRWWLMPMLRMTPADQKKRLAQVPQNLRPLVKSRLEQWHLLPPPLQQEFLGNAQAREYLAIMPVPPSPAVVARQQKIANQFNHFFELTAQEKTQTLDSIHTLSPAERSQMQETLKTFEHLPPRQRQLCVQNYAKFAGMSPGEREQFLKNANRWTKMSPKERQSWRDLVREVPLLPVGWTPHQTPPLPPGFHQSGVFTRTN